jgi:hypothetical protein
LLGFGADGFEKADVMDDVIPAYQRYYQRVLSLTRAASA